MVINIITTGAPVSAAITEVINIVMMVIATVVTIFFNKRNKKISFTKPGEYDIIYLSGYFNEEEL